PLFSALLNYRHTATSSTAEGLGTWIDIERLKGVERTNYPLALNVDDEGLDFTFTLTCPVDIGAERIAGYVQTALESLVKALEDAPSSALNTLPILPCAERQQLLVNFNSTQRSYPQDKTVHDLFETRAEAQPDAVAAIHNAQALTYRELNQRANRLAHHLIGLGVQPGERIAMLLERSLDLVISQLAILKCAAVYVPLDINAPVERQHFMIQDSQAAIVLSHSNEADVPGARRVDLDSLALDGHDNNPHLPQSGEAIAYIMYTSGSTGTPKGVLVPHRAINRLVINNGYADFNAQDRVAFASNPAFDASTLDVWAPLLNGGCVVVVEQDVLLSQDKFRNLLREQAVSVLWMTAGLFHQYADGLTDVLQQLRYLIVGGDVLDPAVIGRVLKSSAPQHLLNGYGPTEATTFTTTFEITSVSEGSRIPIGRPVGNTRAYVLDQHQQPVAVGVAGELYIGGDGVAKGYLNQPELTAEKFIADPFSDNKDARLYRTGDLVRWSADG
ncbi:non-ribosomal peptide synthetase, partial [Pseudomonas syringae]|uniref:non-ribosomal peptide synthetase n=1 Tax=Pseudomonas syringae TaxID=317 RepID=UPI001FEFAE03